MSVASVLRVFKLAVWMAAAVTVAHPRLRGVVAQDTSDVGGAIGWGDEGDSNTFNCVAMFKLLLDNGGVKIQDGEIASGSLLVNPDYAQYAQAMLQNAALTGQGVTSSIDPNTGKITIRTDGGAAQSDNGELLSLTLMLKLSIDAFADKMPPVCKDILIKRLVVSSGAGGGVGDPHLTTLDKVNYNFQIPGVFRLFESANFQVQVFQHKCTPVLHMGERGPSCYQGVAVAFAGSVAKFFIANNKITLGRGSNSLEWLNVHRIKGKADGYRVFAKADEATYVDITLTRWINNYPLLNVALRVSPYFKDPSVRGLLGNWNGKKADDIKDNTVLAQLHGFSLADNLFTCTGAACDKFVAPATQKDKDACLVPSDMKLLHQGFTPVLSAELPLNAFTPVLLPSTATANKLRRIEQEADAGDTDGDSDGLEVAHQIANRTHELCHQVFAQMTTCAPFVTNTTNYVDAVCIGDATMVGDFSIVDLTKIAYLRDCRRELDARIEANVTTADETSELFAIRKALKFGDMGACPGNCSARGACLAAGCECKLGFTGVACDIAW